MNLRLYTTDTPTVEAWKKNPNFDIFEPRNKISNVNCLSSDSRILQNRGYFSSKIEKFICKWNQLRGLSVISISLLHYLPKS